ARDLSAPDHYQRASHLRYCRPSLPSMALGSDADATIPLAPLAHHVPWLILPSPAQGWERQTPPAPYACSSIRLSAGSCCSTPVPRAQASEPADTHHQSRTTQNSSALSRCSRGS